MLSNDSRSARTRATTRVSTQLSPLQGGTVWSPVRSKCRVLGHATAFGWAALMMPRRIIVDELLIGQGRMDCRLWKRGAKSNPPHLFVYTVAEPQHRAPPLPSYPLEQLTTLELLLFSHVFPPPSFLKKKKFNNKKNCPPFRGSGHRQLVLHLTSSPTLKSSLNDLARYGCNTLSRMWWDTHFVKIQGCLPAR